MLIDRKKKNKLLIFLQSYRNFITIVYKYHNLSTVPALEGCVNYNPAGFLLVSVNTKRHSVSLTQ